jgi:hypothetical protein
MLMGLYEIILNYNESRKIAAEVVPLEEVEQPEVEEVKTVSEQDPKFFDNFGNKFVVTMIFDSVRNPEEWLEEFLELEHVWMIHRKRARKKFGKWKKFEVCNQQNGLKLKAIIDLIKQLIGSAGSWRDNKNKNMTVAPKVMEVEEDLSLIESLESQLGAKSLEVELCFLMGEFTIRKKNVGTIVGVINNNILKKKKLYLVWLIMFEAGFQYFYIIGECDQSAYENKSRTVKSMNTFYAPHFKCFVNQEFADESCFNKYVDEDEEGMDFSEWNSIVGGGKGLRPYKRVCEVVLV